MGKLTNVLKVEWGFMKLEDGTVIIFRVAVVNALPSHDVSPFGVEFGVNVATGISVLPSPESMKEVEGKPVAPPGAMIKEGWVQVKILEKTSAIEVVEYEDPELGKYRIRVEFEPAMVSKNTQVRTPTGEPLYVVRWAPKITWEKVEE
ncbi:hypothetical protein [Pyrococcus kukulkanii]|uniref:Uncharacterized protein n=1 Tax=Pyrococcus kukulkanii TaxID=1609559 RepID=A0ABV4T6U6_9EURY